MLLFAPAVYLFLVLRVFWLGPMLGGVLAALVWEAILRPAQPAQHAVQPEPKELLERTEHKDMLEACTAV